MSTLPHDLNLSVKWVSKTGLNCSDVHSKKNIGVHSGLKKRARLTACSSLVDFHRKTCMNVPCRKFKKEHTRESTLPFQAKSPRFLITNSIENKLVGYVFKKLLVDRCDLKVLPYKHCALKNWIVHSYYQYKSY